MNSNFAISVGIKIHAAARHASQWGARNKVKFSRTYGTGKGFKKGLFHARQVSVILFVSERQTVVYRSANHRKAGALGLMST